MKEENHLGAWTEDQLDGLLAEAFRIMQPGERVEFLSRPFLGTKYLEATLTGDAGIPEACVINLDRVDCLTLLEYVEAMRRSGTYAGFRENIKKVRYRDGEVDFKKRNHFFTDWKAFNSAYVVDVTKYVAAGNSRDVTKRLNERHDGTFLLPGIPCRLREVTYIRSENVDDTVMKNLRTGDYIGIYSKKDGLDVSHTGILVKKRYRVSLRHASSVKKHRKVIDEDFRLYLKAKPGIIVFRPRDY